MLTVQEARLAQAARSFQFDASLAPYNLSALQQWRSLSGHITKALIEKVAPLNGGNLSVTTEADPFLKGPRTAAEERLAAQLQSKANLGSHAGQSAAQSAQAMLRYMRQNRRSHARTPSSQQPPQARRALCQIWPGRAALQGSQPTAQPLRVRVRGQRRQAQQQRMTRSHLPKQEQKGVGRCFYTAVPTRATVRTCIDKPACGQRRMYISGRNAPSKM